MVRTLVNFDRLYLGGGNAGKIDLDLPSDVQIVANVAGITGGTGLWRTANDELFADLIGRPKTGRASGRRAKAQKRARPASPRGRGRAARRR